MTTTAQPVGPPRDEATPPVTVRRHRTGPAPAPRTTATAPGAATPVPFLPALEGLRGFAAAGLLLSASFRNALPGGFLALSTFLTLSGFLLTNVLIAEHENRGSVRLRAFFTGRLRRLAPVALTTFVLVVVATLTYGDPASRARLGGDLVSSLAGVANWWFILGNRSAAGSSNVAGTTMLVGTLSIVVQLTVVLGVLVAVVQKGIRWDHRRLIGVLSGLLTCSILAGVLLRGSPNRVLLGTDTRAAEVLVGALLALALYWRLRGVVAGTARLPLAGLLPWLGMVALVGMVVMWVLVPPSTRWITSGGLAGYALLSALVITAAVLPHGPLPAVLGTRPLREAGRVAYGVTLLHWPVQLLLSESITGLDGLPLACYQVLATVALGWLATRYVEAPIRAGRALVRHLPGFSAGRLALVAAVAVLLASSAISLNA